MNTTPTFRTGLGTSDADSITLLGRSLPDEMLGEVTFGELAFWLVAKRPPTNDERVMFEAVLVALADHGFTPTAIAARLTYLSAPDSIQGAVAAGILGGGSRFLGVTEDSAGFLATTIAGIDTLPTDEAGWDDVAREVVANTRAAGRFVPGLGHPVHKVTDPRTPKFMQLAHDHNSFGPHLSLFAAIGRVHPESLGRTLPLNGAGVCGAVLADLGFSPAIVRGFALLARCAGVLGHIAEEQVDPIANDIYLSVDRNIDYAPPA